jgi:hypothetical protein
MTEPTLWKNLLSKGWKMEAVNLNGNFLPNYGSLWPCDVAIVPQLCAYNLGLCMHTSWYCHWVIITAVWTKLSTWSSSVSDWVQVIIVYFCNALSRTNSVCCSGEFSDMAIIVLQYQCSRRNDVLSLLKRGDKTFKYFFTKIIPSCYIHFVEHI